MKFVGATSKHDAGGGDRASLPANSIHSKAYCYHAQKQASHLGVAEGGKESRAAPLICLQANALQTISICLLTISVEMIAGIVR